ncbi:adenylyl-sulfate kinase [Phycicoccus avicenniae]|uniref:adenylyl-sulfate kinase n=1 Tax=Phycicoccus avicenniae TaxID=2828860 RepID=UPI003D2A0BED
MTDTAGVFTPSRQHLDDLDVLRRGLYGPDARPRPLTLPADRLEKALADGALVLLDPEGVPVARLTDLRDDGDGRVTGRPEWLAEPSPRPFQSLHLHDASALAGRPLLVVASPADLPERVPDGTDLLVLASTSLDEDASGNDTVRAAVTAARGTGAGVHVVPVPQGDDERLRALFATLGVEDLGDGTPAAATTPTGGIVLLATGLSGSGKSTIARAVAARLVEEGTRVTLLDGDRVRHHLTAGLGFSREDRDTNVRRIGWVAAEVAHHGGLAICSPIAPHEGVRAQVAATVAARGGRFVLVHVATPLEECERRDRKGLYAAARRGEIPDFTGISAPYDVPEHPDLRIDTTGRPVEECVDEVLALLHSLTAGDRSAR